MGEKERALGGGVILTLIVNNFIIVPLILAPSLKTKWGVIITPTVF